MAHSGNQNRKKRIDLAVREARHVDDFIDDPKSNRYAAEWFNLFRRPAIDKANANQRHLANREEEPK